MDFSFFLQVFSHKFRALEISKFENCYNRHSYSIGGIKPEKSWLHAKDISALQ